MIGVICRADETPAVQEFFEAFKTPWELYEPGARYEVVLATASEIPTVDARLLLLYGSDVKSSDGRGGFAICARYHGASLETPAALPIYGDVLTFETGGGCTPCAEATRGTAGVRIESGDCTVMRIGYDLFKEVRRLLEEGQPIEHASVPTLDRHIGMLRAWILGAGSSLVEVPPAPAGHAFAVCLTHDIDFIGIRPHRFDHTMAGFVYRSTIGAIRHVIRRRWTIRRLLASLRAVVSLPAVYAGWAKDFWEPFAWYLRVEHGLPATYFLIPFKGRPGEHVPDAARARRATSYDAGDLQEATNALKSAGCEIGVHGIDGWHNAAHGREEQNRIADVCGTPAVGVRTHWLLRDGSTVRHLEQAGYAYDATGGYNETVGFLHGTARVFRPLDARTLLELPLHIQDGALFFPQRLDLSEPEADARCDAVIADVEREGGVLTLLWHDRSHAPERFWGDFYIRLVERLQSMKPWFGTGTEIVGWFRQRREIRFERVDSARGRLAVLHHDGGEIRPPVVIRLHLPSAGEATVVDVPWSGMGSLDLSGAVKDAPSYAIQ